jgi:hypothetical protein
MSVPLQVGNPTQLGHGPRRETVAAPAGWRRPLRSFATPVGYLMLNASMTVCSTVLPSASAALALMLTFPLVSARLGIR